MACNLTGEHSDKGAVTFTVRDFDHQVKVIANDSQAVNPDQVLGRQGLYQSVDLILISGLKKRAGPLRPRGSHHQVQWLFGAQGPLASSFVVQKGSAKFTKIGFKELKLFLFSHGAWVMQELGRSPPGTQRQKDKSFVRDLNRSELRQGSE